MFSHCKWCLHDTSMHFLAHHLIFSLTKILESQDLLNPLPADNGEFPPSTSAKEQYGTIFDEGNDDKSLLMTFVQGANLKHLTIEASLILLI